MVDPRLRRGVDASIGWYEDILAMRGIGSVLEDGLWSSLAAAAALSRAERRTLVLPEMAWCKAP